MNQRLVLDEQQQNIAKKIMIALDFPDAASAYRLMEQLKDMPCWFKVGMELFYSEGPKLVETIKSEGHAVFVDLKLHDIPNTVKRASASLTRLGADMFNVHAAGGKKMMEAALEGAEEAGSKPLIIAVTQLTSTDQAVMNEEIGIPGSVADAVLHYAGLAMQSGLDGVVSSAQEAPSIKGVCGDDFLTVTPGIRPSWSAKGDQARVVTPRQALQQGTDFLVIGRPVTQADSPALALTRIIEEMSANE